MTDNSNKVYTDYEQIQIAYLSNAIKLSGDPLACRIYAYISDKIYGGKALLVNRNFLCKFFNTSLSSLLRSMKFLEEANVLQWFKMNGAWLFANGKPNVKVKNRTRFYDFDTSIIILEGEI